MKIGVIADLHIRGKDLETKLAYLDLSLSSMKKSGVDLVACPGDIFDDHRIFDRYFLSQTVIKKIVEVINKYEIPWLIIEGNHDQAPLSEMYLDAKTIIDSRLS